jgi:hypothetical protein
VGRGGWCGGMRFRGRILGEWGGSAMMGNLYIESSECLAALTSNGTLLGVLESARLTTISSTKLVRVILMLMF